MVYKIIILASFGACMLHAADSNIPKKRIDNSLQFERAMEDIKARINQRPTSSQISINRAGPRVEGNPDQRKIPQEKSKYD